LGHRGYILPNIFAECLLAAIRFAALWILFHLLHNPKTKLRLVLAISIMVLQYPFCRVLFFASGGNFAASIACDTILLLTLAYICETESGDLIRPVISALYFNGMLQLVNYILFCYIYAFNNIIPPSFSLWSYFWKTIEGMILLLWALFYYHLARNMTAKAPVAFSILTLITPLTGLAILAVSTNAVRPILDYGINLFLYAGLFGTLIVVLNMSIFYLYTKLSVAHDALVFAANLSHTPPVWTSEQGLSGAFITQYEITPREHEVIEAMLQGKTDKEISTNLNIAVNTVQVHLKRVYRKTGASGRFALAALVRGIHHS
jgi:DNA-binding CsgD family transcriptional regulator